MGDVVWKWNRSMPENQAVAAAPESVDCERERSDPRVQIQLPFGARASSHPGDVQGPSINAWISEKHDTAKNVSVSIERGARAQTLVSMAKPYGRLCIVSLLVALACWGLSKLVLDLPQSLRFGDVAFLAVFSLVQFFGWFVLLLHMIGCVRLKRAGRGRPNNDPITTKTAVVMPIYHEPVGDVERRLQAMIESFRETGLARFVQVFILSDSVRVSVQFDEDAMVRRLEAANPWIILRLVRRSSRADFKAGNIRHFLERYEKKFDYFFVLDADSLVTGSRLMQMIRRMQRDPRLGILQASVLPLGGRSLFTRVWQYSLWRTTPLFCAGLEWVMGDLSVYWGHNALIRVAPFLQYGRLPILPGRAPLGGRVLSQDIVEAALIGRAGYKVAWEIEPGGSFDEIPPDVIRYGERDRRWCQGNLQHSWLVLGKGIRLMHRLYFVYGIMTYLMSALIVGLLACGFLELAQEATDSPAKLSLWLLLGAVPLLQWLPKVLGFFFWFRTEESWFRQVLGTLADIFLSSLLYPLLMFLHCRCLVSLFCRRDSGWNGQQRTHGRGIERGEAISCFWLSTLIGGGLLLASWIWAPRFLLCSWLLLGSWLFSIPLSVLSAEGKVGEWLQRLFVLPFGKADQDWISRYGFDADPKSEVGSVS